jgi:hypothetical protein
MPSQLIVMRPDIIAAEHQLRADNANIGAARAAFFPQVTLTGNYGTASAELDDLFSSGTHAWSFSPTIVLPIFSGGRLRYNLDLSEVRRDLAVASYELTIQTAFRDVADALSASQWLTQQVRIQRNALTAARERARLAQLRYDWGSSAYLEVLEAERDLLDTEQALVQAERAAQSSRVAVFTAMGGGALGAFTLLLVLVMLPLQMLSGGSTPRESMPAILQTIMLASPTTHYVAASQAILFRGAGIDIVWPQLLAMVAIGVVFFWFAHARFRTTLARMA